MRLTQFYEFVHAEFGQLYGDTLLRDHVLTALGGVTGADAIKAGREPREVWLALCDDFDVPQQRWYRRVD